MIVWAIKALCSFLLSIFCYITNPIIVLFCDEDGELKAPFSYWQTWDDSCNPSYLKKCAPKIILFDWDKHYEEYEGYIAGTGRYRKYTRCINSSFSIKERFQRYLCRVYWLTRNCGYGFAFYLFGCCVSGDCMKITSNTDKYTYAETKNMNIIDGAFIYKDDRLWFSLWKFDVYKCFFAGWKIDLSAHCCVQSMIANRFVLRVRKRG